MNDALVTPPFAECMRLLRSIDRGLETGRLQMRHVFTALLLMEQFGFEHGEPLSREAIGDDPNIAIMILFDALTQKFAGASALVQAEVLEKLALLDRGPSEIAGEDSLALPTPPPVRFIGTVHTPRVRTFAPEEVFKENTAKGAAIYIRNIAPEFRRMLFKKVVPGTPPAQLKEHGISVRGSELEPEEVALFMPPLRGGGMTPAHWLGFLKTCPRGREGGERPVVCIIPHPEWRESREELARKCEALRAAG